MRKLRWHETRTDEKHGAPHNGDPSIRHALTIEKIIFL
jgi:hypothetical protein